MFGRWRRKLVCAGIGGVLVGGVMAAGAAAAVPGLQLVAGSSALDSSASKVMFLDCPAGKRVIGTGAFLGGVAHQIGIESVVPFNAFLQRAGASGVEDQDGTAGKWSLSLAVICANPLPGLDLVSASSESSSEPKSVTAPCPPGKSLVGGGGSIIGGRGQVVLDDLVPTSGLGGMIVAAFEDQDGTPSPWALGVHAVCANPLPGLERVEARTATNSLDKSISARCPAGKKVVGAGGEIFAGLGQVRMDDVSPNADLSAVLVTATEDQDGFSQNWFAHAYAVCATV